ncbi:MAG: F0F1 ATP synthase subunit alpha [Candidatus Omnitrophica bacterium]|nr:F0F1 ATP synthase subunit alpha [Candidatus Omnitrophota bacterium]
MNNLKPEEITSIIKSELENYTTQLKTDSVGTVIQVGDAIARVYGLDDVMVGEIIEFPNNVFGMAVNLEEDSVGVIIFGRDNADRFIKEGDTVKRTGKIVDVPVGEALKGRVVNALGQPIDGKGPIKTDKRRPVESTSPDVISRQPINAPLQTGIKAVDAMIPIGRGQRELIIGDRQTGKTAVAIDAIINQKGKGVYCVYVAIGQKISSIVATAEVLKQHGAMEYTTIVSASSRSTASSQFLAPYAGCAMGEEFMYNGQDVLVIYDDLSKHAQAYRQLSLLLRRPPGREAYPGDIFYLHARLLERSAKLSDALGAGSLTALPIIETQGGDITSYIPTNVISITDGQIYLETDLFFSGVRPAINVGLSVSRVGGKAQAKAMRKISGKVRLDLAQYRELVAFLQFGSELDKATQDQITRGEKVVELLKQGQYVPQSLARQVMIIYTGVNGFLDDLPTDSIKKFEVDFFQFIAAKYPGIENDITTSGDITDATADALKKAVTEFKAEFIKK